MNAPCSCIPPAGVPSFLCRHFSFFRDGVFECTKEQRYSVEAHYSGVFGMGSVGYHSDKESVLRMIHKETSGDETL